MRRRRFSKRGRTAGVREAVRVSYLNQRRRGACKGCHSPIEAGDPIAKLTLRKIHRVPCGTCKHVPVGSKRYHVGCLPSDINAAMGYDPVARARANAHAAHTNVTAPPPPPKTQTPAEAALVALDALERFLIAKVKVKGITPEIEAQFKTYQNIKARALRPGTAAEGEVATSLALQRLVKLVF